MGITYYNKSGKYGDIRQGYAVTTEIAKLCHDIDERNPAVVKYARLILGTSEAIRDSIDDIASYALKSEGRLDFKADNDLPAMTKVVLSYVKKYASHYNVTPTHMAYVCAILACAGRGELAQTFKLMMEYNTYLDSFGGSSNSKTCLATLIEYCDEISVSLAKQPKQTAEDSARDTED